MPTGRRLAAKKTTKRVIKPKARPLTVVSKGTGRSNLQSAPKKKIGTSTKATKRGSNRINAKTTTKRVIKPKMQKRSGTKGSMGSGRSKLSRGR